MSMFRRKDEEGNETDDNAISEMSSASAPSSAQKPAAPMGGMTSPSPMSGAAAPSPMSAAPAAAPMGAAPMPRPASPAAMPMAPASASGFRPAPTMSPAAAPKPAAAPAAPMASAAAKQSNKRILTVGNDILLKGEIATCDRLVIEGSVDATLKDVHTVEIAETGSFKGTAEIEDAEISGLFEGELTVRNRLTIYSTGRVRGKITYGEIEIERGGQMTGEISIGNNAAMAKPKAA